MAVSCSAVQTDYTEMVLGLYVLAELLIILILYIICQNSFLALNCRKQLQFYLTSFLFFMVFARSLKMQL